MPIAHKAKRSKCSFITHLEQIMWLKEFILILSEKGVLVGQAWTDFTDTSKVCCRLAWSAKQSLGDWFACMN